MRQPGKLDKDRGLRRQTSATVLAVASFAAIVSYSHIYDLGLSHGQTGIAARLLPLSVDGLILAASLVMLHEVRQGRRPPGLARLMLTVGVAATIGANMIFGSRWGWLGEAVSAAPAVTFVGAAEMLIGMVRRASLAAGDERPAAPRPAVALTAFDAASEAYAASVTGGNPLSQTALVSRYNLTRTEARQVVTGAVAPSNGHAPGSG